MQVVLMNGCQLNAWIMRRHGTLNYWGITTAMAQGLWLIVFTTWLCWVVRWDPTFEKVARLAVWGSIVNCLFARAVVYLIMWHFGATFMDVISHI
jgi:hypothetical protein